DSTLVLIFPAELIERRIEHAFTNRIEQDFSARDNDPALLFPEIPVLVRIGQVEIGHSIGEIRDDARDIRLGLPDNLLQLLSVIGMKPILITVLAGAM